MLTDFLGRELNIGDECVYLKPTMTGSSTIRKVLYKGVITGFKKNKVIFGDTTVYVAKDVIKVRHNDD